MEIFVVLLVLSFLVVIHELGHYLAARKAKITVEEFGVGYPPQAVTISRILKKFGKKWKSQTELSLNWIPFGGFVRMAGETPDPKSKVQPKPGDFGAATIPQRLMVIFAGVVVNFLFGILAFTIVFGQTGIPVDVSGARIGYVEPESPAAIAGVPTQVKILAFRDGEQLTEATEIDSVKEYVTENQGKTVTLITTQECTAEDICQGTQEFEVYLRTTEEIPDGQGALGVSFDTVLLQQYPWYEMPFRSAWQGTKIALTLSSLIIEALGGVGRDLFNGTVSSDVAGPVGIVYQAQKGTFFELNFLSILSFAGVLSINLAIMNVLPIPPLDGGRAVLIFLELIIGKSKSRFLEYYSSYGGYVMLLLLILVITFSDISKIFFGN